MPEEKPEIELTLAEWAKATRPEEMLDIEKCIREMNELMGEYTPLSWYRRWPAEVKSRLSLAWRALKGETFDDSWWDG